MCMFSNILEDNKIGFNFVIFLFIGVLFYYIYTFNVQIKLKTTEPFKSRPQPVNFKSKSIEKEMKQLEKLKKLYKKKCKSQNNIKTDVISDVFDIKTYPNKVVNLRLQQLKEQDEQKLLESKKGGRIITSCLPKLTFDGI